MASFHRFANRTEAGKTLAQALAGYAGRIDTLVLALPRGGVPVAHEVAKALSVPLDIWVVRKIGLPGQEELAIGALAGDNVHVINEDLFRFFNISQAVLDEAMAPEQAELERRNKLYRGDRQPPDISGKTVIIVDDGFATGATMRVAIASLRQAGAGWIVAAAPVGAVSTCRELAKDADEVICPFTPEPFYGVGVWYDDFSQTTDDEVQSILAKGALHAESRP